MLLVRIDFLVEFEGLKVDSTGVVARHLSVLVPISWIQAVKMH